MVLKLLLLQGKMRLIEYIVMQKCVSFSGIAT